MGMVAIESIFVQASRLGALARADGRAAFYRREGLEFCPYAKHEEFYLAGLWRIGWLEGESEASTEWLNQLIFPADCSDG